MPIGKITLVAKFKMDLTDVDEAVISEICRLFTEYQEVVNELIEYAYSYEIANFIELHYAKYHELRQRYPTLPSHYIYCACRHATGIYRSFIEFKKLGMCRKERPVFK